MLRAPLALIFAVASAAAPFARGGEPVDFAHQVLPLIRERCGSCHTNGRAKGKLSMNVREDLIAHKVIVPGNAAASALVERVGSDDPDERMPPTGPALTATQVSTLRNWIDQGAPWLDGFSFAKSGAGLPVRPRRPQLPPVRGGRDHPVDRIVGAYFATKKITEPPPLDDSTFLRRAWLDLVGILPAPEDLDAFLADKALDKRRRVVERLLQNDQDYAEHWLTFWNDLLRNDYQGTGYIDGGRKAITAWLYQSLRANKPYDRFVRELLSPTPESEGFIRGIRWRGVVNASQTPELQFAQNVGQVFLGVNLKCASCHDSFIDSWKLADVYGLAAVTADGPLDVFRCDKPTGAKAQARSPFPDLGSIDPAKPKTERLRRLAELLTAPEDGLLSRTIVNRLWHRLMGRGIVHPVDVMSNEPWSADLLDFLATDLVDHAYDLKRTLALIATSRTYQSRSRAVSGDVGASDYEFRGPIARRITAEQFVDCVWRITETGPAKPAAAVRRRPEPVRASLVESDLLTRSLGRPNREQVVSTRPDDLSTLQALDLTNGRAFAELLDRGAAKLQGRFAKAKPDALAKWLFRSALCRAPTAAELETAQALIGSPATDQGVSDLLWAVFMLPEFQLIE